MSTVRALVTAVLLTAFAPLVGAHSGPPYPILSNTAAGPYEISIWSDPDSTDDGSAEGKFWVTIERADKSGRVPDDTRATVTIRAVDRQGPPVTAQASPEGGAVSRQYAALVMDHEGRFTVVARVRGPLGDAMVESAVDATYDLRPVPFMLAFYLLPFLAVGSLWVIAIRRRRRMERGAA